MALEGLLVENWHRTGKARESGKERDGWAVGKEYCGLGEVCGGGQCWGRGVGGEGDSVGDPARGTAQGVLGDPGGREAVDLKGQFFGSSPA